MIRNCNVFCTLFNSKYLDKGLVLYHSIKNCCQDFKLYVFAFDNLTYNVLVDLKLDNLVVIPLFDFEDNDLLEVKKSRSSAEYCWTCTPATISYVLEKYHEEICTYVDADMFFYCDPRPIFEEMIDKNKSVVIVEHRFPKKNKEKKCRIHGKYCVEFNTFVNNSSGLACLRWWKKSCLEKCHYSKKQSECVGDQTYLEEFETRFDGVLSSSIIGAGVAPWNTKNYFFSQENDKLVVKDKCGSSNIIFYHFQNVRYLPFGLVNTNSGTNSSFVKNFIYKPYLLEIEKTRSFLHDTYGISFEKKKAVYKNPVLAFIQNYIMPFKIKNFNNIINLRRLKNDSMQ